MSTLSPFLDENIVESYAPSQYEAATAGVRAGSLPVDRVPALASHRGKPPALLLRWNDMPVVPAEIDVVVHLHGYSNPGMTLSSIKKWSGLDLAPIDNATGGGRSRPTLTVLPRGNFTGVKQRNGELYVYNFPALIERDGLTKLVSYSLDCFARKVGGAPPRVGRLILTAHSGGGSPLLKILRHHEPHVCEVHVYDALYQDASALAEWAAQHIQRDKAGGASPGACRVFYRGGTRKFSGRVQTALDAALESAPEALRARYRTEASTLGHWEIPRQYGWRLLADAGADVPNARREAAAHRELEDYEEEAFMSTMSPFQENGFGETALEEPAFAEAPFEDFDEEDEGLDLPWEPELEATYAETGVGEAGEEEVEEDEYGEAELEEEQESAEVEGAEAEGLYGEPFAAEPELYETGANVETYPSGATLRIVSRSAPEGTEHWDPNNSNVPLVDTSDTSIRLSTSFTVGELARSGGKTFNPARIDPKLVAALQKLRDHVGKTVTVTSSYRPYLYNIDIYKARGQKPTLSQHSSGRAVDVKIAGMNGMQIAKAAIDALGGNIGVGIGPDYAHIDVRGTFAKWTYFKDKAADARARAEIVAYQRQRAAGGGSTTSTSTTQAPTPTAAPASAAASPEAPSVDDFVAAALTQRGDPYVFGAEANFNDANPKAFDCSELVQWSAARAGIKITDGARNQRDACRKANTLIPVEEGLRTRGALLFRIDETGEHNHVAISLGNGQTMEAKGKKYGVNVFPANDRKWTHAGIVPGFRYPRGGSPPPPPPEGPGDRVLKRGMRGEDVRWMQRRLQMYGFDPGTADGVMGKRTDGAVRAFQTARGLPSDGKAGRTTIDALARPV